jgi:hypothetical protein
LGAKYLLLPKFCNFFSGLPFSETVESCHLAPKRRLEHSFSCDSRELGWRTVQVRCNGTAAQNFYFYNGQIVYIKAGLCIDAGNMANGTELFINKCNGSASQYWQIK